MAANKRDLPKLKTQNKWKKEFTIFVFHITTWFAKSAQYLTIRLISCKNCNVNFIKVCTNFRKSAVIDHAKSEMHMKSLEHQEIENLKEQQSLVYKKNCSTGSSNSNRWQP